MRPTRRSVAAAGLWLAMPGLAAAASGFQGRAEGHAYQCGPTAVGFARGGGATLSTRGAAAIRTATRVTWTAHGAALSFAKAPPATLSEYGATVTFATAGRRTVCVLVR